MADDTSLHGESRGSASSGLGAVQGPNGARDTQGTHTTQVDKAAKGRGQTRALSTPSASVSAQGQKPLVATKAATDPQLSKKLASPGTSSGTARGGGPTNSSFIRRLSRLSLRSRPKSVYAVIEDQTQRRRPKTDATPRGDGSGEGSAFNITPGSGPGPAISPTLAAVAPVSASGAPISTSRLNSVSSAATSSSMHTAKSSAADEIDPTDSRAERSQPQLVIKTSDSEEQAPIGSPQSLRDYSMSPPMHHSSLSGGSGGFSSPASSLIFERSVQGDLDEKASVLGLHFQEDHIPPVLEASANAITDQNFDPDQIEVVSLRHRSSSILRSPQLPGGSESTFVSGAPSPVASESNSQPFSTSPYSFRRQKSYPLPPKTTTGDGEDDGITAGVDDHGSPLRLNEGKDPANIGLGVSTTLPSPALSDTRHILSFYSFADVLSSEQASQTSCIQPNSGRQMSPYLSRQRSASPVKSNEPPISPVALGDGSEDEATVTSMRETLRRNTGEIVTGPIEP